MDSKKYYFYSSGVSAAPQVPVSVLALNISPNPTERFARIQLENAATIKVFDGMGRLVHQQTEEAEQVNLDLLDMPAGIYSVHVLASNKRYAGRLVKQ